MNVRNHDMVEKQIFGCLFFYMLAGWLGKKYDFLWEEVWEKEKCVCGNFVGKEHDSIEEEV